MQLIGKENRKPSNCTLYTVLKHGLYMVNSFEIHFLNLSFTLQQVQQFYVTRVPGRFAVVETT